MRFIDFNKLRFRAIRVILVLGLSAIFLSGCGVTFRNTVTVTSVGNYSLESQIIFSGNAAEVLETNPALINNLVSTIQAHGGEAINHSVVTGSSPVVTISFELPNRQIAGSSLITSIKSVHAVANKMELKVALVTTSPRQLISAIRAAANEQRYGSSVAATMLASTTVSNQIMFPGKVLTVSGGGIKQGNRAIFMNSLNNFTPGNESAIGSIGSGIGLLLLWIGGGAFILIVALVAIFYFRNY
jgi:hypothetical protein